MFKYYKPAARAGADPAYWEDTFRGVDLGRVRAICEASPLFPLLERTVQPDRLFLDGGCGAGQWVKYFALRGFRTVGVDNATALVEQLNLREPELDVRQGDVRDLPFESGAVHTYYSGGVAEHFEAGPHDVLREARRVVADDGWFLCSVPTANLLRRTVSYRGLGTRLLSGGARVVPVDQTQVEPAPEGCSFHQYVFDEVEFGSALEGAGFEIERSFGFSWIWSAFELKGVKPLHDLAYRAASKLAQLRRRARPVGGGTAAGSSARWGRGPGALHTRALVWEDEQLVGMPEWSNALGHMRMYVCRPV